MHDAERVAVLEFLAGAGGWRITWLAQCVIAIGLEQRQAVHRGIVRNAGNRQVCRRIFLSISRRVVHIVRPVESDAQLVDHGRTDGERISDRGAARIVDVIAGAVAAAVGQARQRRR